MRSYLADLLRFALSAIVVYAALIIITGFVAYRIRPNNIKYILGDYGHLNSRIRDIPHHSKVDILFLGSSHAYRGFDPRVFKAHGLRIFNLGSNSQSPIQSKVLVDQYLDQLDPGLVVMDVFPTTFNTEGVESALDLIANDTIGWRALEMACRIQHVVVNNTLLYASFRQIGGLDADYVEPRQKGMDTYVDGGYVQIAPTRTHLDELPTLLDLEPPPYQWHAFQDVLHTLHERGVPIMLVQTPVTRPYQYPNEESTRLGKLFGQLAPYVDMSRLFGAGDSTRFYDGHHMTQTGVEDFNRAFIDTLYQRKMLPVRPRGMPQ